MCPSTTPTAPSSACSAAAPAANARSGLTRPAVVLILALLSPALAGCGGYDLGAWIEAVLAEPSVPALATGADIAVEVLAEGLESPWALAAAPDGRIFITERAGRLRVFRDGRLEPEPVVGVPDVSHEGQGGLMEVALHPRFAENRWIYLAYTVPDAVSAHTRVSRFTLGPAGLEAPLAVFAGVPGSAKHKHFGCRLAFDPDGHLFVALGERGEGRRAQDLQDLNGKILRLTEDGGVPADNPFAGRPDARAEIFSTGHRNPQGLAIQPGSGRLWATEHGPTWNDAPGGGDEVNLIRSGANYGWPEIHHRETAAGMVAPLVEYTPAVAPSGAIFYDGEAIPAWRGSLLFATLAGEALIRLEIDGERVTGQQRLLAGQFGRLRDLVVGADGMIYAITSDTDRLGPGRSRGDRLLRLTPSSGE